MKFKLLETIAKLNGRGIQQLRDENNLTQQQLANKLKVNQRTVARWERTKSNIDFKLSTVLKFLDTYDFSSVTKLINETNQIKPDDITDEVIEYLSSNNINPQLKELVNNHFEQFKHNIANAIEFYRSNVTNAK